MINRITKRREANVDRMRRRIAATQYRQVWLFGPADVSRDPRPPTPTPTAGDPVPGGVP